MVTKMRRFLCLFLSFICMFSTFILQINADEPEIDAASAILMEASTGQILYEKNADELLHPASITKIMTLILIFDALESGEISLSDTVTVSANAAGMGGSQVFLEEGETQSVETMLKCISIASANDACVAMAEFISGSESAFVTRMNDRALNLGMTNTRFVNCCGLDADNHMTTARDVALMSKELITKYPQIHDYTTIWMDTIIHSTRRGDKPFTLTNTNKLIKQYEWATGLKTGSTSLAKFCLSATATKNNIQLISVIMASPNGKTRVSDSITLLNHGFDICHLYKDDNPPVLDNIEIDNTLCSNITAEYSESFSYIFSKTYDESLITKEIEYISDLSAPVYEGQIIGTLNYSYEGENIGSVNIICTHDIPKSSYKDYLKALFNGLLCG